MPVLPGMEAQLGVAQAMGRRAEAGWVGGSQFWVALGSSRGSEWGRLGSMPGYTNAAGRGAGFLD